MKKRKIYFDMDGTLAEWKNIHVEVTNAETATCVKEEVYKVLKQKGYYYNLKPYEKMLDAVKQILRSNEMEVFILSCVIPGCSARNDKLAWLRKYLPQMDEKHIIFVPDGEDKSLFVEDISYHDILVDDYTKNLKKWHGIGVKVYNGINGTKGTWQGNSVSITDAPEDMALFLLNLKKGMA